MKKLRKLFVFALSLALLLLGIALNGVETQAASKTHKVKVSLSGTKTVRVKSGKRNVKKKTVTVKKGDKIYFSHTKNKKIRSVVYKSMNKKYVTITKKGKAAAKKAGTARIKITVKRNKGKALSTWVKIKVKGHTKPEDNTQNPSPAPDSDKPSNTPTKQPSDTPAVPTTPPTDQPSDTPDIPTVPPADQPSDTPVVPTTPPTNSPSNNGKSLVLYFSRAGENYNVGVVEKGSTQIVAEMITEETGADLFKLETVNAYPEDYMECVTVTREEKNANARPRLKAVPQNLAEYKNIYLGYPIWHADMPMALYTFLENNNLSGKTVLPFCTHAGSGLAGTVETIRTKCQGAAVTEGFAIDETTVQSSAEGTKNSLGVWLEKVKPQEDTSGFDLEKGTVMLNNGIEMPILGIGTYRLSDSQAENSVYWALRDGYRLIDTARIYGNEAGVGRGIKKAIGEGFVTREEIFVTTKMWTADYDNGTAAIDASLSRLGLDYIDLMILHHSQPSNDVQAYQAMEQAVSDGKLKSIGLSNYYTAEDFDRLVNATSIVPALLQNETHPYHQSTMMKEHLKQYGTVMESWFPLGGRGNTQRLFEDETISEIAKAHGKTSAQIILRWHLQAGNIAIPGSSNEAHIQENYEIFDFSLSDGEMERMAAINKDERFASY
jgi:diketogulonate reductase-like aldo/keto reductase/flavodoxin